MRSIKQSAGPKAPLFSPLIMVRGFPTFAAILVALAMICSKHENIQSLCTGGALGILIGCAVFSYSIKSVTLKQAEQPSEIPERSVIL